MIEEKTLVRDIFSSIFMGSPETPVWKWADERVYLDEIQSSDLPRYDSSQTPWNREIQDALRDPKTNEISVMKSSRTGVTEGALNVLRYMPTNYPGNALYCINSREKAIDVFKGRVAPQIRVLAKEQVSDDPNDFSTLTIRLKNMIIKGTGSGSPSPFRETWYRVAILDEPEDHEELPDGTTYDLVKSRFTTVNEYTLYMIGKPQAEGGIIHDCFLRGSQEKWLVPCPRCGEKIELVWDQVRYSHCKDEVTGDWDFEKVVNDSFYQCQACDGRIDEWEKYAMVKAGAWCKTPKNERMMLKNTPISPEPGVRSFHISDLYSPFPQVTWGKLAKKWISCAIINLSEAKKEDFRKNFLGLPVEAKELHVVDETILALRGGVTETVWYDALDENGEKEKRSRTEKHGERFGLCYDRNGKEIAPLPCDPILLTISIDKQKHCYKWTVFAWQLDGQAWLIDYGISNTKQELLSLQGRGYHWEDPETGERHKHTIYGGGIDRGDSVKEVYRIARTAQKRNWRLYPLLGWGGPNERYMSDALSEKEDILDGGVRMRYYKFHDHSIKVDFYFQTVQNRSQPRLWLPDPVPQDIVTELTSEYWDFETQRFVHPDGAPPNDYGDTCKMQIGVIWPILSGAFQRQQKENQRETLHYDRP
jgi:hypothetical protein